MISKSDLLNAKEIYLSKNDELLIPIENCNVGYRFTKQTLSWGVVKRWYSWRVYCKALTGEEALAVIEKWTKNNQKESKQLNKAIEFAVKKHSGQFRKGTVIPYILHPLEVLEILYSMRADTNLLIAGVLHDTVEDTDTTLAEIEKLFGADVAALVASNSEDKSKSWDERKKHTIDELKVSDRRVKMLIMSDKLSNIRSIAYDFEESGDELWQRFNAPKEKQAWYYDGILDALNDFQCDSQCEKVYWELTNLFKDVFVKYYLESKNNAIYQICDTGVTFCLKKGSPLWNDITDDFGKSIVAIDGELISRSEAERIEDVWNSLI